MKGMIVTGIFFILVLVALFGIDKQFLKSAVANSISGLIKEIYKQILGAIKK